MLGIDAVLAGGERLGRGIRVLDLHGGHVLHGQRIQTARGDRVGQQLASHRAGGDRGRGAIERERQVGGDQLFQRAGELAFLGLDELQVGQALTRLRFLVLDATSGGPYTEPFTVDYAYGAAQSTAMFTQPLPERWIRFEGLNTADGNREVVIDLYRVAINPAKELSIITDELLKFELSGQVLADLTKPVGGDLGQFGRLVLMQ